MAVSELVDTDNENILPLVILLEKSIKLVVVKLTFTKVLSHENRKQSLWWYLSVAENIPKKSVV